MFSASLSRPQALDMHEEPDDQDRLERRDQHQKTAPCVERHVELDDRQGGQNQPDDDDAPLNLPHSSTSPSHQSVCYLTGQSGL
jgi:hypothetical protein